MRIFPSFPRESFGLWEDTMANEEYFPFQMSSEKVMMLRRGLRISKESLGKLGTIV